ncbi:alpha/beta fold hydrolase [Phytomonospora endophytica]|uniref:Pimeloyl-ACP methyl ester carboxylesterase n=1 Tax=Phytomonospora endophytica TaxID=714109 RepID=A0A841FTA1_9ACTN|nr:alpha/beta hydrolase [Phytomonospora endophytica]MBB6036772.1 pimeloyl-ACP methyl ester carboxylesterase [Phytomonospora endophytica]GIG68194.1 oxidoreductase [Phytomonospora endophytica]
MDIYHEDHGTGEGRPLVLIHGALSGIGTSFGEFLPLLAKTRRVIAVELQAHGRTRDIDRPFGFSAFAADVVELLDRLGVERADVFGWSMGGAVALRLGTDHPERVGRLVLASMSFDNDGLHPGLLDGIADLRPEHLHGSEFHEEYLRTAPDPDGWPNLVEKVKAQDAAPEQWTREEVSALEAPAFIVLADSDIVRNEHAVEFFGLLGGGVAGDLVGLPASRLAILPGSTHTTIPQRADWLAPMIGEFLDEG